MGLRPSQSEPSEGPLLGLALGTPLLSPQAGLGQSAPETVGPTPPGPCLRAPFWAAVPVPLAIDGLPEAFKPTSKAVCVFSDMPSNSGLGPQGG